MQISLTTSSRNVCRIKPNRRQEAGTDAGISTTTFAFERNFDSDIITNTVARKP